MAQDEELQVIEERDIYDKTVADIPADAKLLEAVRNRPRAYVFFGILALAIFIAMAPQYWIALSLAIVGCIAIFLMTKNEPVLEIYDGFMVCHKRGEPDKVCIIPDEQLIYWQLVAGNTSVIQVYFEDEDDPENALCALIHTINSFQASNALDHYHREKALVEIRREASRKKRLINPKK